MSVEENKAIVRSLVEDVVNRGDLDRIPELFAPDYKPHDPSNPVRMGGLDGVKQFVCMLHAGISDLEYTMEDLIAEGDKVAYRWSLKGRHTGPFMGIPATGRTLSMVGVDIIRLVHGKIAESWVSADALSMLRQLGGIAPSQGTPPALPRSNG